MKSQSSFKILDAYGNFFRIFTIYNAAQFQPTNQLLLFRNIFEAIVSAAVMGTFICFDFHYCYENEFDLNIVAHPCSLMIGGVQIIFIYISIAMKNGEIKALIDDLQGIIQKREFIPSKMK